MNQIIIAIISMIIFFTPIFILGVFIYLIYKKVIKGKEDKEALLLFASSHGYQNIESASSAPSLSLSSFPEGQIIGGIRGVLAESQNNFSLYYQTETRGTGKEKRVYKRTIIEVDIPDTQLQILINSKINNDASSGGNLMRYSYDQRFTLEGDFGEFFDIFMPRQTQSEVLTILAPNSMIYILKELADYDIEINGPKLFLFRYEHINVGVVEGLMPKIDSLLKEMWLRKNDTRRENISDALVARTATDSATHRGLAKNKFGKVSVFVLIVIVPIYYFMSNTTASKLEQIKAILIVSVMAGFSLLVIYALIYQYMLKRRYKQAIKKYK